MGVRTRGGLGCGLVLALVLTACSAGSGEGEASGSTGVDARSVERFRAELDASSGAVIMPYDRFLPTWHEMDLITVAGSAAVSLCAREAGVTFVPPEPITDPVYASEPYFGPWTRDQAERFGFVRPMSEADLAYQGYIETTPETPASENTELTDEDWLVIDGCAESSEAVDMSEALRVVGPWVDAMASVSHALMEDPRTLVLLAELGDCFGDRGLAPMHKSPAFPEGSDGTVITEEQIALAINVVECKEEIGFTSRMADVEAELQAPIVAKYEPELAENRQRIDEALRAARELLARAATTAGTP